jgi:hypothetical protein
MPSGISMDGESVTQMPSFVDCSTSPGSDNVPGSPFIIDTMPRAEDPTVSEPTFASFQWFDLAAGFKVPKLGRVMRITAAITTRDPSRGAFTVGIAANTMIGNPASPTYFSPPPGSLWETRVCSPAKRRYLQSSALEADAFHHPGEPRVELQPGQHLDLRVDIPLPAAGTYWLYTRFIDDDVFASWTGNLSIKTDLVARRCGTIAEGTADNDRASDRTFFQTAARQATPGLRIAYECG